MYFVKNYLWAIGFLLLTMTLDHGKLQSTRQMKLEKKHKHHHLKATSKLSLPIKVKLYTDDIVQPNTPFTLYGEITSIRSVTNVEVKWTLPQNITVIEGSTHYTVNLPTSGGTHTSQLTVISRSDKNEKIHLTAKSKNANIRYMKTAQYNTLLQAQMDREIANLKQRNQEFVNSKKTKQLY